MYWMLENLEDAEHALNKIIRVYQAAYEVDATLSFK
jgi:hypothetical protein